MKYSEMHCVCSTDPLFLLPLGILALKCSYNGRSYGTNLWWLFVLWTTNRKWILLWHVPWGRVGFVCFFIRSGAVAITAIFLLPSCSQNKVALFLVVHPIHKLVHCNRIKKLEVKARMIHCCVCVFILGVYQVMTSLLWKPYAKR